MTVTKHIMASSPDYTTPNDPKSISLLKRPNINWDDEICLLAAYSATGKLTESVLEYVSTLVDSNVKVVLCLAIDDLKNTPNPSNLSLFEGIVVRENGGYDFSAWSSAFRLLPSVWSAKRIHLTNDSVFVLPALFPRFLERIRNADKDIIAATESYQHTHHAQSYFLTLQGNALTSKPLRDFFCDLKCLSTKEMVIKEYELNFYRYCTDLFGLTFATTYNMFELFGPKTVEEFSRFNVTHKYWFYLVSVGLPFVKVELLRDNPTNAEILQWHVVFDQNGASVKAAIEHCQTPRFNESSSVAVTKEETKSEFLQILSELNRVRLNSRKRRRLKRSKNSLQPN